MELHKIDDDRSYELKELNNDSYSVTVYNNKKRKVSKIWYSKNNNKKDRKEDKPAQIIYNLKNDKYAEFWFCDGKRFRKKGPDLVAYYPDGKPKIEMWNYRLDKGPTEIIYNENGAKINERWTIFKDMLYRRDDPASILYDNDGNIISKEWYTSGSGEIHRCVPIGVQVLPAKVDYDSSGNIVRERWYNYGKLYRYNDRPADIKYYRGIPIVKKWYSRKGFGKHRDCSRFHLPAVIKRCGQYDIEFRWEWWEKGEFIGYDELHPDMFWKRSS